MKLVNLEAFWTVQLQSGSHVPLYIFPSKDDAYAFAKKHDDEVRQMFRRWMDGDLSVRSEIVESTITGDVNGNPVFSYSIAPHALSHVAEREAFTAYEDHWRNEIGADSVRWGNPATARPKR